jgi:hypothetical protein
VLSKKFGTHDWGIALLIPAQLLIKTSSYHETSSDIVRVKP